MSATLILRSKFGGNAPAMIPLDACIGLMVEFAEHETERAEQYAKLARDAVNLLPPAEKPLSRTP